jgi:hypothetical protein
MYFRVRIVLKSGNEYSNRVNDDSKNLSRVLSIIDTAWQDGRDGYVQFGAQYFRISEIAAYSFKRLWFWWF